MKIRRLNPRWTLVGIFLAVFAVWLYPTLAALHGRWSSAAIEYSYFVVLLAAFMLYKRVTADTTVTAPGGVGWLLLFLPCVIVVFISDVVGVAFIPQLLFPVLLVAAIGLVLGNSMARRAILPIAFLYFAIPFWQAFEYFGSTGRPLNEALRQLTTIVASGVVKLTGLPALIDGDFIVLPAGTFEIAEGCSGRAYFITALELSFFYAVAFLKRNSNRVLLVGVACVLALLGNWIRVVSLIMIGYFSNMQNPLISNHGDFGWVVFCMTTLPFVLFGRWLESRERTYHQESPELEAPRVEGGTMRWLAAATVVLIAVILMNNRIGSAEDSAEPIDWDTSIVLSGWNSVGDWPLETRPQFPAAGSQRSMLLSDGAHDIAIFLADFPFQSKEKEVIHFGNDPFAGQGAVFQEVVDFDSVGIAGDLGFAAHHSVNGVTERLVWVGYRVAGKSTADRIEAKLSQLRGVVNGRWDAQVYVLATECGTDCSLADDRLRSFVIEHGERLFSDERRESGIEGVD